MNVKYIIFLPLFFLSCTPDGPKYITENEARTRLYLVTITKCNSSGGNASSKALDIFSFVEKQFKTNGLSESDRKQVVYFKKDYMKCENFIIAYQIDKCDFKGLDLVNLISKGGICKLEPASYYNF